MLEIRNGHLKVPKNEASRSQNLSPNVIRIRRFPTVAGTHGVGQARSVHKFAPLIRNGLKRRSGLGCGRLPERNYLRGRGHWQILVRFHDLAALNGYQARKSPLRPTHGRKRNTRAGDDAGVRSRWTVSRVLCLAAGQFTVSGDLLPLPLARRRPSIWAPRCRRARAANPGTGRATSSPPYLALHRAGFALPRPLPSGR